jgi:hypothetical protein
MSPEPDEVEQSEESARERWEVFQQPDGHWRWRWLPSAEEREQADPIVSGETFDSPEEAQESAHSAFPDLPGSVERPRSAVAAAREAVSTGTTWARRGLVAFGLVGAGYLVGRRAGGPDLHGRDRCGTV